MRVMEGGTKQQSMNHKEEAYQLFNQAYELYCLFWGLNMNLVNIDGAKWQGDSLEKVQKEVAEIKAAVQPAQEMPADNSMFGKLKSVSRKAVDCCIE